MSATREGLAGWISQKQDSLWLVVIVAIAAFFRFYQFTGISNSNSVPPGLSSVEATSGVAARQLAQHFNFTNLTHVMTGRDGLFTIIQAVFVSIFGHTAGAIHIAPSVIACLTVLTTYLWIKDWFGHRTALVGAIVMAVTPWSVILTRTSYSASLPPLLITLSLWLATRARWRRSSIYSVAAALTAGFGFYCYPGTWPVFALVVVLSVAGLLALRPRVSALLLASYIVTFVIMSLPFVYGLGVSSARLVVAPQGNVLDGSVSGGNSYSAVVASATRTFLMINFRGDNNAQHNVPGEPQLNIFIGIMAVGGLLAAFTLIKRPRYWALVGLLIISLIPGVVGAGSSPDALRTLVALVPLAALAGLGVDYMISLWYQTFPINSAARTTGLAAMIVLLGLTVFHGYTEYFIAWGQSPQTHLAQDESTAELTNFANKYHTASNRVMVIDAVNKPVIEYLADNPSAFKMVQPADIAGLPQDIIPVEFIIDRSQEDAAIAALKLKYAGGVLTPHYSAFSNDDLYDVYEVTK